MISPKPVAIASIVPVKPTPEAKPRYSEATSNEITGSTLNRMIKTTASTMAMAVWRATTAGSCILGDKNEVTNACASRA